MRLNATDRSIVVDMFDLLEEDYPDKSTEWLIAMTCDRCRGIGIKLDDGDVSDVLEQSAKGGAK